MLLGHITQRWSRVAGWVRRTLDKAEDRRHAESPLCAAPLAPPSEYFRLWEDARRQSFPTVERYEETCEAAIDAEWLHRLALLTQVTIKRSAPCYQHGRLLYATLVRYARDRQRDNLTILETGTARGFSSLCLARALADAGATGKIVTFDVLPHDVPIYWNCVLDADGPRTRGSLLSDYADLLGKYLIFVRGDTRRELTRMVFPRVHFAFFDSVHTYNHLMAEFAAVGPRQRPGDLMFFDDYTPALYPGVVKAADEICDQHGYAKHVIVASPTRQYLIAAKEPRQSRLPGVVTESGL